MPPVVKKGMSVTILTTLATSLILTVLYGLGNFTLKAHDNIIDVEYVKKQMDRQTISIDGLNESLGAYIASDYKDKEYLRQEVIKHELRIQYCEKWQAKCEESLK